MFGIDLITTKHETACGPACLKMLLDFYGIDVDLDTLIEECGVTVNGCTAADLKRVAITHGLTDTSLWQEPPSEVLTQDRPGIVWWRYNHFVVYGGLNDKGEPVLFNPMRGQYAIDAGTFEVLASGLQAGTCVVLTNGKPLDVIYRAEKNISAGELFASNGETCIALRPIARGEALVKGWNYNNTTIIDALNNAQKED